MVLIPLCYLPRLRCSQEGAQGKVHCCCRHAHRAEPSRALAGRRGFANLAVGLRPDVDIFEGAACEFVLVLLLAFIVTYSTHFKSRW